MNNLQREIQEIQEANREEKAHKEEVLKRAKNIALKRCMNKIIKNLGSIPREK